MHDHDLDLVMAIVAGEAVDAQSRAEVEACPECFADLEAQRVAIDALQALGPATLEPAERRHLRAAIREELNLTEPAPAPEPERRSWRRSWAWVGATAMVLVGFVAVAGIFDGLSVGGDDAADTVALATSTTVGRQADQATEATELPAATTTTAASLSGGDGLSSIEDAEGATESPSLPYRYDFESVDPDTLRELASLPPANVYAELGSAARSAKPLSQELELACRDAGLAAVGPAAESYHLFEGRYDGAAAYLWVYVTDDGPVTVVHEAESCAVITVLP